MTTHAQRSGSQVPGVAFVTGGARGLGGACAVAFAKEGASAVVIVDIGDEQTLLSGQQAVEAFGVECLVIRADVTNEQQIKDAVAHAVAKFGRIDYAVNFAGIGGTAQGIVDFDTEGFKRTMDVNCVGMILSCKYEMQQMLKQSSHVVESGRPPQVGSIVNCASVNSIMAMGVGVGYTTSKHAVMGITKTAALEGRKNGIRVNAVSPGFLLTDMVKPAMAYGAMAQEAWQASIDRQGRAAMFEEVGDAVVLLSTPKMSLVNGHNLLIDNGFTINETNF